MVTKKFKNLDKKYLSRINNVEFQPIFIMGLQRSGTSILYKLLSKTNYFNVVTAYHVIKNNELLFNHINKIEKQSKDDLQKLLDDSSQIDRGIDKLKIEPDFPEEYGFVLAQKSGKQKIIPENVDLFIEFCKKIQYISKYNKLILLKNPFDFNNFMYIKSVFPKAKFIFIHRNPIKTLNSQLKAMRGLLKNKSYYMSLLSPSYDKLYDKKIVLYFYRFLYNPSNPLRIQQVINRLSKATNYYLENIDDLSDEDYISIKYEGLCKQTNDEIRKILDFLNLNSVTKINFKKFMKPRKSSILDVLRKKERHIINKLRPYLETFGYI